MPTYRELLLDPRWQRMRLEKLQAAGWSCEACFETEATLHVHHMRYISGRKPWEYEQEDLRVLCADCHEEHHQLRATLDQLLTRVNSWQLQEIVAVVGGIVYADRKTTPGLESACRQLDSSAFHAGVIASLIRQGSGTIQPLAAKLITDYFPPQCFNPNEKAALDAMANAKDEDEE